MIKNINIDSNIIADHFIKQFSSKRSARQSISKIKKAYKTNKFNSWEIYVKAYNHDISQQVKGDESSFEHQISECLDKDKR